MVFKFKFHFFKRKIGKNIENKQTYLEKWFICFFALWDDALSFLFVCFNLTSVK